jgi:hypothetical protein
MSALFNSRHIKAADVAEIVEIAKIVEGRERPAAGGRKRRPTEACRYFAGTQANEMPGVGLPAILAASVDLAAFRHEGMSGMCIAPAPLINEHFDALKFHQRCRKILSLW